MRYDIDRDRRCGVKSPKPSGMLSVVEIYGKPISAGVCAALQPTSYSYAHLIRWLNSQDIQATTGGIQAQAIFPVDTA